MRVFGKANRSKLKANRINRASRELSELTSNSAKVGGVGKTAQLRKQYLGTGAFKSTVERMKKRGNSLTPARRVVQFLRGYTALKLIRERKLRDKRKLKTK